MAIPPLPAGHALGTEGRYVVRATLGVGGFGITYRCEDQRLQVEVVVKELAVGALAYRDTRDLVVRTLPGQESAGQELVRRFLREARQLVQLGRFNSPHLVRVTDLWEENGTAYYAMDFVDAAGTLSEEMRRTSGALTHDEWNAVCRTATQLLDALATVHGHLACHGDVKPANVLRREDGSIVLIDFGTARAQTDATHTVTSAAHTAGWAAPELSYRARSNAVGPWSDLYGWAMVVYGLAAPHPLMPHSGDPWPLDAGQRQLGDDPYQTADQTLRHAGVPGAWADAIHACLALRPADRPASVADVLTRLGTPAAEPVPAPLPSAAAPEDAPPSRASRSTAIGRGVAIGVGAATVLAIAGGALSSRTDPPPVPSQRAAALPLSPLAGGDGASVGDLGLVGVEVPAGRFWMGSPEEEPGRSSDESPRHQVDVAAFWMSRTEMTQGQWSTLWGVNPALDTRCGEVCPVENVTWWSALATANELSRRADLPPCYLLPAPCEGSAAGGTLVCEGDPTLQTGPDGAPCTGYRLPTESEWEYAARAGDSRMTYQGDLHGDLSRCDPHPTLDEIAWTCANAESQLHPTGSKRANAWGLHDMLGNVWEWTYDRYAAYPGGTLDDPPDDHPRGGQRVVRGGSWDGGGLRFVRAANRDFLSASGRYRNVGVRLVRTR
jgi:formylglycine-generating enzyme required for sulfatase activity/serine/threonine protein kinase